MDGRLTLKEKLKFKYSKILEKKRFYKNSIGNSLAVKWLGLCAFTALAWVQSLVGTRGTAKKNPPKNKTKNPQQHEVSSHEVKALMD